MALTCEIFGHRRDPKTGKVEPAMFDPRWV